MPLWVILGTAASAVAQTPSRPAAVRDIPLADATAIFQSLRPEFLPPELRGRAISETLWRSWLADRNADVRSRLEEGDADSAVNLLLYGVTFTAAPRVTEQDIANMTRGQPAPAALSRRLEDLIAGVSLPKGNPRLQFVREVLGRARIDPATESGRDRTRRWLAEGVDRTVAEYKSRVDLATRVSAEATADPQRAAIEQATVFQARGLAPDTTLFPNFGIEEALAALKANRVLEAGDVRRIAVVGPGLDVADKREGYDFYPLQTIQPFALIDSALRLGLAAKDAVELTTLDVSPHINAHVDAARERARRGEGYVVQLSQATEPFPWLPPLADYWRRFGDRIAEEMTPLAPPSGIKGLVGRAVRVRPSVVLSIHARELNIVLQRLDEPSADQRFDLVVATNVLLYYSLFEQALAASNIAAMLRPGGLLLTNTPVPPLPPIPLQLIGYTDAAYTQRNDGDRVFWYQRLTAR